MVNRKELLITIFILVIMCVWSMTYNAVQYHKQLKLENEVKNTNRDLYSLKQDFFEKTEQSSIDRHVLQMLYLHNFKSFSKDEQRLILAVMNGKYEKANFIIENIIDEQKLQEANKKSN